MNRSRKLLLALALLLPGPGFAAPKPLRASPDIQQVVDQAKARAGRLTAARRWSEAALELGRARSDVEAWIRQHGRPMTPARLDARYLAEARALNAEFKRRAGSHPSPEAARRLADEFRQRRLRLEQRYHQTPTRRDPRPVRAALGRGQLLLAALDDAEAALLARQGHAAEAGATRDQAGLARLRANDLLGRKEAGRQVVARLLASGTRNPAVYSATGDYLTQLGRFAEAESALRGGLRLLESGRARQASGRAIPPAERARLAGQWHRELAYCLSRQGKQAESAAELRKAAEEEAAAAAALRPRAR